MLQLTPEQIVEIADQLESGCKCFVNKKTNSLVCYPDELRMPVDDTELFEEEMAQINENPDDFVLISSMDSRESFGVMEDFVTTVKNKALQDKLSAALGQPKPFQKFKYAIDHAGAYREKWFAFKREQYINWVEKQVADISDIDL